MRLSSRAIVTSVAACALAVGWLGAPGASAGPASSEPSAARHIVVLKDGTDSDAVARDHGRRFGAQVERVYHNALKGYVATFKGTGAAEVARDPRVAFVELDQKVSVDATGTQTIDDNTGPWGLDRIDDDKGLDKNYSWSSDGTGVTAYIIDTGIQTNHSEFDNNRASFGFDAVNDATPNGQDCDGHGTHVAGTVGGKTYGVAKNVSLVEVRVLDCTGSGSWSGVIAGIDWVAKNHTAKSVANMSLGGPASSAVDTAVANAINSGVTFAVAAGNGNQAGIGQDACKSSPARVPAALTVGATDKNDTKAKWSNYGTCVDWFAPGVGIVSSVMSGGSEAWSGTSMATPHTAGVVAQYLSSITTVATPTQVRAALVAAQSASIVKSAGKGSPTTLLRTIS
jgi:subtilisin family serine protease